MPSPVQRALAAAARAHARVAGVAVVYHAGDVEIEIADAVLGNTPTEVEDVGGGAKLRAIQLDWLILVVRMVDGAEAIEPTPGHRIVWEDGDRTRTFEVQVLGTDGCYRWSGPGHDRYRIHTREIPTE